MATNISNTKSTFIGFLFQISYNTFILYLGVSNCLFFKWANINIFLERFENIYNNCQMLTLEEIHYLT